MTGRVPVDPNASGTVIQGVRLDPATIRKPDTHTIGSSGPTPLLDLVCWGDSMWRDQGELGVMVPDLMAAELGVDVANCGVNGQTSTEIALRQGGLDVFLNVAGNVVPAAVTPVAGGEPRRTH